MCFVKVIYLRFKDKEFMKFLSEVLFQFERLFLMDFYKMRLRNGLMCN